MLTTSIRLGKVIKSFYTLFLRLTHFGILKLVKKEYG